MTGMPGTERRSLTTMIPERYAPQVYAVFRVVFGFLFIFHGLQKLFGMFGGRVADLMSQRGSPGPSSSWLPVRPSAWSPDGQWLLFEQTDPKTASDVWVLPAHGDRTPRPFVATTFEEADAHFSPGGKWVAYTSDESGHDEVYVRSFPDARQKTQISAGGGVSPRWAPGGKEELYFLSGDGRLMAVNVREANPLRVGAPTPLFETSLASAPTGTRPLTMASAFS